MLVNESLGIGQLMMSDYLRAIHQLSFIVNLSFPELVERLLSLSLSKDYYTKFAS